MLGLVNEAKVFNKKNVNRDQNEQDENNWTHEGSVEQRDRPRSEKGKNKRDHRGRQKGRPLNCDVSCIALGRDGCPGT